MFLARLSYWTSYSTPFGMETEKCIDQAIKSLIHFIKRLCHLMMTLNINIKHVPKFIMTVKFISEHKARL